MNTYQIQKTKWSELNIFEQMGNISSEVGRSFKSKRHNNIKDSEQATFRAIELFDITSEQLASKKSPKLKEVLRAKEVYLDAIYDSQLTKSEADSIEKYFMQYAIAARLNR